MHNKNENKNGEYNPLNIEIECTNDCNLRCTYCFEDCFGHNNMSIDKAQLIIDKSEIFLEKTDLGFTTLRFTLWGGEPTLNPKFVNKFLKLCHEKKYNVFMYTNGLKILDYIEWIKNGTLNVQISYDGMAINDICRLNKSKNNVTKQVNKTIDTLIDNKLEFSIKSTVTPDTFHLMPECWKDIKRIDNKTKEYGLRIVYTPTIDYYNIKNDSYKLDELKVSLMTIAKYEIQRIKSSESNVGPLLTWFIPDNPSVCSAGAYFFLIDLNLNIFPCHGCLYQKDKNKLIWCNLNDDNFINITRDNMLLHKKIMYNRSDNTKDLATLTYAVRCNSEAFANSDFKEYEKRWIDYSRFKSLDNYFDIISKIKFSIINILGE